MQLWGFHEIISHCIFLCTTGFENLKWEATEYPTSHWYHSSSRIFASLLAPPFSLGWLSTLPKDRQYHDGISTYVLFVRQQKHSKYNPSQTWPLLPQIPMTFTHFPAYIDFSILWSFILLFHLLLLPLSIHLIYYYSLKKQSVFAMS